MKGRGEELECLGLGSWSYQFILLALQLHHVTDGHQHLLKALKKLLTVLASSTSANIETMIS